MTIIQKEACVGDFKQALQAQENGATRIELCDNLYDGGTTQSLGMIKAVSEHVTVPIRVIIRPRGGDFYYSDIEKEIMLYDIEKIKKFPIEGIVIGALTKDNQLDLPFLQDLVAKRGNLKLTFHKAIDEMSNPIQAVKDLEQLGFDNILTSGTKATAQEGVDILKNMIQASNNIEIIVAGGVTNDNFDELHKQLKAKFYHGKKIVGDLT